MSAALSLPPPRELVLRGQDDVVAYACPSCGLIISTLTFGKGTNAKETAESYAREHCLRVCLCGVIAPRGHSLCSACRQKEEEAREARKLEYADLLLESEYTGPVFWKQYFRSTEDLRQHCLEENVGLPSHVWACKEIELKLDVDTFLSLSFEEHEGESRDLLEEGAEAELEEVLLDWCDRYGVRSWQVNYTNAVVLENVT